MPKPSLHHPAPPVTPGPLLRTVGFGLSYTAWALDQAVASHAATGSVESSGFIEPCDIEALDDAADTDAIDAWADACAPTDPAEWPAFTARARWELTDDFELTPSEADRAWWAERAARDVSSSVLATL